MAGSSKGVVREHGALFHWHIHHHQKGDPNDACVKPANTVQFHQ